MKYAAIYRYIPEQERVQAVRPAHRAYLGRLREQGQLAAAGPFADGTGALIIYEAPSREDAEQLIRDDPFHQQGIFVSWTLYAWNQVF